MPVIELQGVYAGYGKKQMIHDISLPFPKGRLISIIGPNGSGKSTLLKTVMGILSPASGDIFADGVRLSALSRQDVAKKIAYLAQGRNVPDMTVEQLVLHGRFPHLCYPRRYTGKDHEIARAAMEQTKILELADKQLSSLSGGMRQNAYIAMALAQDTDYILMDEPTTYLDISHQLELMKTLRSLADNGKGIIIVMHDLPLAFTFSDGIAVMKDGKQMVFDTPQKVCSSGIIRETFHVDLHFSESGGNYAYDYSAP